MGYRVHVCGDHQRTVYPPYTHTRAHTHTHIHTYTHIHTHTHRRARALSTLVSPFLSPAHIFEIYSCMVLTHFRWASPLFTPNAFAHHHHHTLPPTTTHYSTHHHVCVCQGLPLFPGESDVDQLFHILKCFGRLTDRQVKTTKILNTPINTIFKYKFTSKKPINTSKYHSNASVG